MLGPLRLEFFKVRMTVVSGNPAPNGSGGADMTPAPSPATTPASSPPAWQSPGSSSWLLPCSEHRTPGRYSPDLLVSNDFAIFSPVN